MPTKNLPVFTHTCSLSRLLQLGSYKKNSVGGEHRNRDLCSFRGGRSQWPIDCRLAADKRSWSPLYGHKQRKMRKMSE